MKNLKAIRTARGLSQDDLAVLTGISQPALSRLERGTRNPRPATVTLLALILNVRPKTLAGSPERAEDADQPAA
ncbi:MAG: helix-turn-helix domain-containing protein [Actinomycetota bacterium]|nr:helix-turn-helix domain-containing protein [Actinomycetota bacterium]